MPFSKLLLFEYTKHITHNFVKLKFLSCIFIITSYYCTEMFHNNDCITARLNKFIKYLSENFIHNKFIMYHNTNNLNKGQLMEDNILNYSSKHICHSCVKVMHSNLSRFWCIFKN